MTIHYSIWGEITGRCGIFVMIALSGGKYLESIGYTGNYLGIFGLMGLVWVITPLFRYMENNNTRESKREKRK